MEFSEAKAIIRMHAKVKGGPRITPGERLLV